MGSPSDSLRGRRAARLTTAKLQAGRGPLLGLIGALSFSPIVRAQDVVQPPTSEVPLRLSPRCTCARPDDFRTLPIYAPEGINNAGVVAGSTSARALVVHPALFMPSGSVEDLLKSDLRSAHAEAINNAGMVAGRLSVTRANGDTIDTLFRFSSAHGLEELPTPVAEQAASAVALNEQGDILVSIRERGFVWSAETRAYTELPALGRSIEVNDMNDAGDVVGAATDAAGRQHAVLWTGRPYSITKLPGPSTFDGRALSTWRATAINRRGTIVGGSYTSQGVIAVAWMGPDHAFRFLGEGGSPTDVNEQDLATGSPSSQQIFAVQVMWDVASAKEIRLPMPTEYMHIATDLNDSGTAVGWRYGFDNFDRPAVQFPQILCQD